MKEDLLNQIIKMRLDVAFLMENKLWINTEFFKSSSVDFLNYIFPKSTNKNSNYYLDPTKHSIDKVVGANYFHLFRLPSSIEEQISKKSSRTNLNSISIDPDQALKELDQMANGLIVDRFDGPINIGSSDNLSFDHINSIAAHYYSAFKNGYQVYPYLN